MISKAVKPYDLTLKTVESDNIKGSRMKTRKPNEKTLELQYT